MSRANGVCVCVCVCFATEWKAMNDVVDPITYNDRYTMPKYIVAATGDEFFPPGEVLCFALFCRFLFAF